MQVFDPTRAMNAFTAGAQIGEGIRQRQTQAGLAPLVARGDYQAASQFAGQRGDLQSAELYRTQYMDALAQAGEQERQRDKEVRQGLASLALKGLNVPDDQIPAVVMQNADELRRLGFGDDKIQQWATPGVVTKPLLEGFLRDAQDLDKQISSYFAGQQPDYGFQSVPGVGLVRTDQRQGRAETILPVEKEDKWTKVSLQDGEYEYILGKPETLRRIGSSPDKTPAVSVNAFSEKGENKFQEGLGSQAATNFGTIIDQGRAATAAIGNLDTMESLLDSIDYTGFGGDTLLQVQRAGAMLGFEIPDLPAKEAAKRLSSQMALSLKTDLPGPMSNADREFLLSIPPNLNSTAAGNDAILFILRKREERKQDMMQSLLQANPQTMEEMRAWENEYLMNTPPMFTPATQQALLRALSGASQ